MNTNVDLRQLSNRREEAAPAPARRRHLWTRVVLPLAVLLGFTGVLAWAARDTLLPSRPVTVVTVMTSDAEEYPEGTPLFQAAGWVEPRPTPILVPGLTEGIIDKLLVVEGQEVKPNDAVALMIARDAELAVRSAEADLRHHQADVVNMRANLAAAALNLKKPLQLQIELRKAEAELAHKETELATLPAQITAAQARRDYAKISFEQKKKVHEEGAFPVAQFLLAKSEWETADANLAELKVRQEKLAQEVAASKSLSDALRQRLELKVEEKRLQADAEAKLAIAEVHLRLSEIALETARLRLDRMTVRAPVGGRVLALVARPGSRLMGLAMGAQDASTVVALYDELQVRADVRLEDVPRVRPGMKVLVDTPSAPDGPVHGEVLFLTSQADIQKNTLQVKVALHNPPATVRPDMLVRTTFLAPPPPKQAKKEGARLRLFVPRALVETADGGTRVWVADQANGVARLRAIKLGLAVGDTVEVTDGLNPSDRLISGGRDGLHDGARITVTGEDAAAAREQPAHHGKMKE